MKKTRYIVVTLIVIIYHKLLRIKIITVIAFYPHRYRPRTMVVIIIYRYYTVS